MVSLTSSAAFCGLLVLCTFICTSYAAGCHGKPEFGVPNTNPIYTVKPTFITKYLNGTARGALYSAGKADDSFLVAHVWGTPYEMGFSQGTMMKDHMQQFFPNTWKYMEEQIENGSALKSYPKWLRDMIAKYGLELALDLTWDATKHWITKNHVDEMRGISDATGVNYLMVRNIHLLGALTQGHCSMYGAWGDAIKHVDSKLMQLRALDWDVDGPFKNNPSVTIYHPDKGDTWNAFMNIGWTGWIGAITGVSSNQIGISEIGVSYPGNDFGKQSRVGYPFTFLLRDVLQYDKTWEAGVARIGNATRTCDLLLGVGDGKADQFRGMAVSNQVFHVYTDTDLEPRLKNHSHPKIHDIVYWGMDWICPAYNKVLSRQLNKYYGNISAENTIRDILPIVKTGDLHAAIYDLTNQNVWISNARKDTAPKSQPLNAYDRPFTRLDCKALWSEPDPAHSEPSGAAQ